MHTPIILLSTSLESRLLKIYLGINHLIYTNIQSINAETS